MTIDQKEYSTPLSVITGETLDRLFRVDLDASSADFDLARNRVLRSSFAPSVLYLISQGVSLGPDLSPEDVLRAITDRSEELKLDSQLLEAIKEGYVSNPNPQTRDWKEESLEMSLGDKHPLNLLRQAVVAKLDVPLRQELAKLSLAS